MVKRTASEQKFWDEIAKEVSKKCFKGLRNINGCSHLAREYADRMLRERRDSQSKDNGR